MTDQAVLITGCSSGIGLCAAQGLKARGYRVFATARREQDVEKLKGLGLESFRLDLADPASIREAVGEVLEATSGRLYGLFNNGAYGQPGAVEDLTREALREQFEANLFGTHELTTLIIPVMRAQEQGRIIQNSSLLGFVAMPFRGAYIASKFALEGLTDTMRMELRGSGVHVSIIEPGPILSRFRDNAYAMYNRHIEPADSVHRHRYEAMEARLQTEGPAQPFTLGPEAVLEKLIHALEAKRPKARYCVTFPTYLFGGLKRILPDRVLDAILSRIN